MKPRLKRTGLMFGALVLMSGGLLAQSVASSRQIVASMVANENEAEQHRGRYLYVSEERSERTGGHLWREGGGGGSMGEGRDARVEGAEALWGGRAAARD